MKVAIVTGSSYGIGAAVANTLLEDGYKVYGISRSKPSFSAHNFTWLQADLFNIEEIKKIVKKIPENTVNLLVNNAGIAYPQNALDFQEKDFMKQFQLNFIAPIEMVKALFPKLRGNFIINISSVSSKLPESKYGLYCSSKAALDMYFGAFVKENPETKVIGILPDYVDTPLLHDLYKDGSFTEFDVILKPDDVAHLIQLIVGSPDKFENGEEIVLVNNWSKDVAEQIKRLPKVYNADTGEITDLI